MEVAALRQDKEALRSELQARSADSASNVVIAENVAATEAKVVSPNTADMLLSLSKDIPGPAWLLGALIVDWLFVVPLCALCCRRCATRRAKDERREQKQKHDCREQKHQEEQQHDCRELPDEDNQKHQEEQQHDCREQKQKQEQEVEEESVQHQQQPVQQQDERDQQRQVAEEQQEERQQAAARPCETPPRAEADELESQESEPRTRPRYSLISTDSDEQVGDNVIPDQGSQPQERRARPRVSEASNFTNPCAELDGEEAIAEAQRLLEKPEVVNNFTLFEDPGDELAYHRRRSHALGVFVQAFLTVKEAGETMVGDYDFLQEEVRRLSGEAAYWHSLAQDSALPSGAATEGADADTGAGTGTGAVTGVDNKAEVPSCGADADAALAAYLPGHSGSVLDCQLSAGLPNAGEGDCLADEEQAAAVGLAMRVEQ